MISSCDDQDGVSMKLGWGCMRTFEEVWSTGQEHGLWSQTVLVSTPVSPFTSHGSCVHKPLGGSVLWVVK